MFKHFLVLQAVYLLIAVGYNLLSIWLTHNQGVALIDGRDPRYSILSLMLLLPVIYLGASGRYRSYLLTNTLLVLLIAYGGVINHILYYLDGDLSRYSSIWAWLSAIVVNAFGVLVGLTASYISWRSASLGVRRVSS